MDINTNKKKKKNTTNIIEPKSKDFIVPINSKKIYTILRESDDILLRQIYVGHNNKFTINIFFIANLSSNKTIAEEIVKPLYNNKMLNNAETENDIIDLIQHGAVYIPFKKILYNSKDVIEEIFHGDCVLVFDNAKIGLSFDSRDFNDRSITTPSEENVIKGSKDCFVELLITNKVTIRKRIKNTNLSFNTIKIGKQTNTTVCLVYINHLTNPTLIEEIKKRIENIDVDSVLIPGQIEETIVDNKLTMFPQSVTTERPDKFCSGIMEGQVGIVIDGLPITYLTPATFNSVLQATEDYSTHFLISTFTRILRYFLVLITIIGPSYYTAITTFHHELIPTALAYSISASKKGVPFPVFIEIILMLLAFEILVEAGVRLPKVIGQTISVVGALIVGQSAVEAKIVSPIVVIVIAATAISSFSMPNKDLSNALRVWRMIIVIISSILGLYGLILGLLILLYHLCKMEVLGVPYLYPFVSAEGKQIQDALFRFPLNKQKDRPYAYKPTNKTRTTEGEKKDE